MRLSNFLRRKKEDKSIKSNDKFKCKHCNIFFQDKEHLSRHNKKAHGGKDDFMPTSNPFQV
jgi:hypothetical protein